MEPKTTTTTAPKTAPTGATSAPKTATKPGEAKAKTEATRAKRTAAKTAAKVAKTARAPKGATGAKTTTGAKGAKGAKGAAKTAPKTAPKTAATGPRLTGPTPERIALAATVAKLRKSGAKWNAIAAETGKSEPTLAKLRKDVRAGVFAKVSPVAKRTPANAF